MDVQTIIDFAPFIIGIGICLVIAGHLALRTRTLSNSLKGKLEIWLGPLIWIAFLALTFRFLPTGVAPKTYGMITYGWLIVGFFVFVFYARRRGVQLPLASIEHVPVLVTYWLCSVQVQKTVRSHSTFELAIGLTEHVFDIRLSLKGSLSLREIERRLSTEMLNLFPTRFGEAAMVATGGLHGASPLKLHISGPAFRIQPAQQDTTAKSLTSNPARALLFSEHHGEHFIRLEFVHNGITRGGMTVPIRVTERFPLLPDWAGRAVMILGGMAAGIFSIVQIVVKVIELME